MPRASEISGTYLQREKEKEKADNQILGNVPTVKEQAASRGQGHDFHERSAIFLINKNGAVTPKIKRGSVTSYSGPRTLCMRYIASCVTNDEIDLHRSLKAESSFKSESVRTRETRSANDNLDFEFILFSHLFAFCVLLSFRSFCFIPPYFCEFLQWYVSFSFARTLALQRTPTRDMVCTDVIYSCGSWLPLRNQVKQYYAASYLQIKDTDILIRNKAFINTEGTQNCNIYGNQGST